MLLKLIPLVYQILLHRKQLLLLKKNRLDLLSVCFSIYVLSEDHFFLIEVYLSLRAWSYLVYELVEMADSRVLHEADLLHQELYKHIITLGLENQVYRENSGLREIPQGGLIALCLVLIIDN